MIVKRFVEHIARGHLMLPLLAAFVLVGVLVTEATYRNAKVTLDNGIALTDARIAAAELLQALSDQEMATRLYLLTGQRAEADWRSTAANTVEAMRQRAFVLVAQVDTEGEISMDPVRRSIEEQTANLERWMKMADAGHREEALRQSLSDSSRSARATLRTQFAAVLERANQIQQRARVSLYDGLMFNRVAIHLLMALSAVALLLFARELRKADRQKQQEQEQLALLVNARTAQLRELAGHMVNAREDERASVARELHDEMGGLLTAIKLEFARLRRVAGMPEAAAARLLAVESRVNEGIALKRRIVENLHPSSLDQLGLVPALEVLCSDVASTLDVPVHTDLEDVRADKAVELTIYRLVQESLTNASKYARCRRITVSLKAEAGRARVTVADDGRGFDSTTAKLGSHGLLGMRVRVESHSGMLLIDSAPGRGTVVTAMLPLAAQPSAPAAEEKTQAEVD